MNVKNKYYKPYVVIFVTISLILFLSVSVFDFVIKDSYKNYREGFTEDFYNITDTYYTLKEENYTLNVFSPKFLKNNGHLEVVWGSDFLKIDNNGFFKEQESPKIILTVYPEILTKETEYRVGFEYVIAGTPNAVSDSADLTFTKNDDGTFNLTVTSFTNEETETYFNEYKSVVEDMIKKATEKWDLE